MAQLVAAGGRAEVEVRRSRFLAFLLPCASIAEAGERLDEIRRDHPKATHHVWAWRILAERGQSVLERSDDDGEPGGTAGRPTLQVLQTHDVVRAIAITVRYFGGIKLGAGGLVRAYAAAAQAAVSASTLRPHAPVTRLRIDAPFALLGALESFLDRAAARVLARRFDPDPILIVEVPVEKAAELEAQVRERTGGRARVREEDAAEDSRNARADEPGEGADRDTPADEPGQGTDQDGRPRRA